ncbi:MAG: HEAT repeat domain-containing protein [Myxococcota bacterium]
MEDWLQRIQDEPFLGVLCSVIAALVAFTALSVGWLVARSLWDGRMTRMRDRFWHGLGKDLVEVVGDPAGEAAWLERAKTHPDDVLRACLNDYMIRTAGDYRDGLARLYRGLGLLDGDLAQLRSRRWAVRMRALRRLATVVTPEHRQEIWRMADEGGEVRLLVAQIIGRIGQPEDVLGLLATWNITSRLSEYPVHVMLDGMPPEGLRAVLERWDTLGQGEDGEVGLASRACLQRIALSLGARKVPSACQAILPHAAEHASVEVRIAAARACGSITSATTLALLGTLAADAAWEVRAQAVKALGAHRTATAADVLVRALSDKSFWVRQNAAAALGQHGADGVRRLKAIADQVGDRYARDAAEHVLTDLAIANQEALARHEALVDPRLAAALAGGPR